MLTFLILTGLVATIAIVGTVITLAHESRGTTPPPASHALDPASIPPALRLTYRS
jgi:hypothetical protein